MLKDPLNVYQKPANKSECKNGAVWSGLYTEAASIKQTYDG